MRMKSLLLLQAIAALGDPGLADATEEESASITTGGYRLILPDGWRQAPEGSRSNPLLATRHDETGARIAHILGASLGGTAKDESDEFAEIEEAEAEVKRIEEHRTYKTSEGVEFISLLMQMAVADPDYGAPICFWSLYYPLEDGRSVTFKVICGTETIRSLAPEVIAIARAARFEGIPRLPIPTGKKVSELADLVGTWNLIARERPELDPMKAEGVSLRIEGDGSIAVTVSQGGNVRTFAGTVRFVEKEARIVMREGDPEDRTELWINARELVIRDPDGRSQMRLERAEAQPKIQQQ